MEHGLAGLNEGSEVEHGVKRPFLIAGGEKDLAQQGWVAKLTLHYGNSGGKQVTAGMAEVVENQRVMAFFHKQSGDGTTYIPGTPRNQDLHKKDCPFADGFGNLESITVVRLQTGRSPLPNGIPSLRLTAEPRMTICHESADRRVYPMHRSESRVDISRAEIKGLNSFCRMPWSGAGNGAMDETREERTNQNVDMRFDGTRDPEKRDSRPRPHAVAPHAGMKFSSFTPIQAGTVARLKVLAGRFEGKENRRSEEACSRRPRFSKHDFFGA
jgi:hypothetical protein